MLRGGLVVLVVEGEVLTRKGAILGGEVRRGEDFRGGDARSLGFTAVLGGSGGGFDGGSGTASASASCSRTGDISCPSECSRAASSSFRWGSSGGVVLSDSRSVGGMRGLAMPVPGFRIGNSSSGEVKAFADPGFRIGNSSSSMELGMGMGAEIVPRMDLGAGFGAGLARPEPDFQRVGMVTRETSRGTKVLRYKRGNSATRQNRGRGG